MGWSDMATACCAHMPDRADDSEALRDLVSEHGDAHADTMPTPSYELKAVHVVIFMVQISKWCSTCLRSVVVVIQRV